MDSSQSLTVSEITAQIKSTLMANPDLKNIWVKGEISNYSKASSGHIYFSLKDAKSLLRCTFFSYQNKNYRGRPLKDGMEVQVFGTVTLYEAGGQYNLNVNQVEELGQGDILLQIEKLKLKLEAEGLFDPAHKKPIPRYPLRIGVATSPTGAAVEDIVRIATERFPKVNILIAPCNVQGSGAEKSIVEAIQELNNPKWNLDVIIAGRGGGSFEDLMAFNTEPVVRAFYNSRVPIISAVGHQIDVVLTDFAADAAEPTPTAAAKLAVPDMVETSEWMDELNLRILSALRNRLRQAFDQFKSIGNKLVFQEPLLYIAQQSQRLDDLIQRTFLLGKNFLSLQKAKLQPYEHLPYYINNLLKSKKQDLRFLTEKIESYSHKGTLDRGYALVFNSEGKLVTNASSVKKEESLEITLAQGKLGVVTKEIQDGRKS